jgi:hypothetical protein
MGLAVSGAEPPAVSGVEAPDAGGGEAEEEDAGMSDADRDLLTRGPRHRLLVRVLMEGFTVAFAGSERIDNHTWFRTLDGGYVDSDAVGSIDIRSEKIGLELDATTTLPVGIVTGRGARFYTANERGEISPSGQLAKFASFAIVGQETRGERVLYAAADGKYVARQQGVVVVRKLDPPRAVRQWDKWIVVDLTKQTLTAYEGAVPVFVTLVSTGKEGYETPCGVFRILAKHVSTPMDDFALGEPYAIDEVPYVMYFQQNVALHGLFNWVHPFLPEGWHGVYATDSDAGTIVWVRKPDPDEP